MVKNCPFDRFDRDVVIMAQIKEVGMTEATRQIQIDTMGQAIANAMKQKIEYLEERINKLERRNDGEEDD